MPSLDLIVVYMYNVHLYFYYPICLHFVQGFTRIYATLDKNRQFRRLRNRKQFFECTFSERVYQSLFAVWPAKYLKWTCQYIKLDINIY